MFQQIGHYGNCHVIIEATDNYVEVTLVPHPPTEDYLALPNLQAFKERPLTLEQVTSLVALPNLSPVHNGSVYAEPDGQKIYYRQYGGLSSDGEERLLALLARLIDAYPRIVSLGGAAASILQAIESDETHPLRPFARQLLIDVAAETRAALGLYPLDQLRCPICLVSFAEHQLAGSLIYLGCRLCSQSQTFLEGRLVAVLDAGMAEMVIKNGETIRVNWLIRRDLFDFETVEIIQADDEAVERLAMQIGNDTDLIRRPRYPEMICTIAPTCSLSENTLRILQRTFGQIVEDDLKTP